MDPITVDSLATVAGVAAFVALVLQVVIKPVLQLAPTQWRMRYGPLAVNLFGLVAGAVAAVLAGLGQGPSSASNYINLGLTGLVGASIATQAYEAVKNTVRTWRGGS